MILKKPAVDLYDAWNRLSEKIMHKQTLECKTPSMQKSSLAAKTRRKAGRVKLIMGAASDLGIGRFSG